MDDASLQFLGAAQTVTGSRFLLNAGGARVLVECGMFQGLKQMRERNWAQLPFDPAAVDAAVLTHAHIDHSGYLPRLYKYGFRGPVHCTPATAELLGLLLPDAGHLQEEEARFANKRGYSKHRPALPLYTKEDATASLALASTLDYGERKEIAKGITLSFYPSGHILGAGFALLEFGGRRLVVSGDIGGYDSAVMRAPADIPDGVDTVLVESTYGGRSQDHRPIEEQLREKIAPALARGGVVVIPAFAVGRTTLVLYHLRKLQERGELPDVPVFVDSPMATDAVKLYCKYGNEHNLKVDLLEDSGRCLIRARSTNFAKTPEESKAINRRPGPAIVISASGMATAGRVLHHLKQRLPDQRNLILLVGFQAEGTRGRALLEGASEVKLLGELVPVRAQVAAINGLSAHGDADDVLRWLRTAKSKPRMTYLVHGEREGLRAMSERVGKELGYAHLAPEYLQKVAL